MLCPRCKTNYLTSNRSRYCTECAASVSDAVIGIRRRDESIPLTTWEKIEKISERKEFRIFLAVLGCLGIIYAYGFLDLPRRHPPGILVSSYPLQTGASDVKSWEKDGFTITPLYRYQIKGVVLAHGNFFFTNLPHLSPTDVTLGWGPVSDQTIIDQIDFVHGPRYVAWSYPKGESPLPPGVVETHVSNNHLLPANDEIRALMKHIHTGDILSLKGFLIRADSSDGTWGSSITREDTGNGACEVMWVDEMTVE